MTAKLTPNQITTLKAIRAGIQTVDGRSLRALRARKFVKGSRTLTLTVAGTHALG